MGNKVLFLGSSVTYGFASNGVSFVEFMPFDCVKEAVSGTAFSLDGPASYIERLRRIETVKPFDLLVIQLSTNDVWKKRPLGNKESCDPRTVTGAIRFFVEEARRRWNAKTLFYTSPRFDSPEYGEMVKRLLSLKEEEGYEVLDLWNDEGFLKKKKDGYMADDVHPTLLGYKEWWAPAFEGAIRRLLEA